MNHKKRLIVANWKMKLSNRESINLAEEIVDRFAWMYLNERNIEMIICPSHISLAEVGKIVDRSPIKLGVQNIFYHNTGSYTGQISPAVAHELGAEYAIIGHSEFRKYGKDTNEDVHQKIKAALDNELVPIVCVGETFDEYHDKKTEVIIIDQVTKALEDIKLKENQRIVIAYEPVWVIGSGQAIRHNIVEYIIQIIIHTTIDLDQSFADKFQVIYGGSVDEKNINDFIIGNILTGVIVGNNSLKVDSFMKIVQNIKL